ncbi:MAG: NAD(+) synthase [Bacteroidota bacterium]
MKYVHLAGSCLNQTPLDITHNTQNIIAAIRASKEKDISLLCLPELAISGYGCEDVFFNEQLLARCLKALEEIIEETENIVITVGLPLSFENSLYNSVAVICNKELLGFVAKQELPGDGIYYEPRWFKRWPEGLATTYMWKGQEVPMGDLIFDIGGVRVGLEICEDAWNGVRPAQQHYLHNVDLILNPSASNFAFGKTKVREMLVTESSRGYNCTYVYSNHLGNEAGRIIYDGEILIAQSGKLLARNRRFSYQNFDILSASVDVEYVHIQRKKSFNFESVLPTHLISCEFEFPYVHPSSVETQIAPYESKEEEFYLAETLALFDYMRKSRSRGFVLSLSGGADSSTCAVMCAHAIKRGLAELGEEGLAKKLTYLNIDPKDPVREILTCVYQATQNSGDDTLTSAKELAEGLGARFQNWDVEPIHQAYIKLAEESAGRPLSWETDDITLQNIQARLRSPGIWMIANMRRSLLITTSNRSEAAVGYATMDGDTSGGLAPMGGIDKQSIIQWLQWAEKELDLPSLQYVNSLKPTAELRPSTYDQTDEADLMPYDILDEIEACAIRDYKSPVEVFESLKGITEDHLLKAYIRKFFTLWSRNQWKRERYAPSFHLDDKNLDPKTWCRFPILNGGYEEALKEMDNYKPNVRDKSIIK